MNINEKIYGFEVKQKQYIEELQGEAYELHHEKSGAKILVVDNQDENKVFCVGFKTLPEDSTGVFHILEHSVLNGSQKYPVKETFVELLKCSMKNYLNAMTFPDKTIYPFATVSEKDYLNLMDVYLNAVFYPNIYHKKEIFEQEGWHYDFAEGQTEPHINGVVYNEMKGVFSSVDSRLTYEINKAMFPDNTYGYVSGGNPDVIPELTYEKFLATHKKYYSSDNCYMILYGQMNIDEKLAFIDREYLSQMSPRNYNYDIPMQSAPTEKTSKSFYPLEQLTGKDVQAALAYHIGTIEEQDKVLATYILANALMGNNEAPLKKAVLEAHIGADVSVGIMDDVLQPYVFFVLKNTDETGEKEFKNLVNRKVKELCEKGIDKELLIAAINSSEFMMNEKGGNLPNGIISGIDATAFWIHGQNPFDALAYNQRYQELRQRLEGRYFEELLEKLILKNEYQTAVSLFPEQEKTVQEAKEPLVAEKLELLNPLTIEDLKQKEKHIETDKTQLKNIKMLYNSVQNNAISYAKWYFDLGTVAAEDMPYIQLMTSLFANLDTSKHTANQLNILLSTWLGDWNAYLDVFTHCVTKEVNVKFVMGVSALNSNLSYMVSLPEEMILETLFQQKEEIHKAIQQTKLNMERSFVTSGNYYGSIRMSSYHTLEGMLQERTQGYSYYEFLKNLDQKDEAEFEFVLDKLKDLQKKIFRLSPLTVSFSGKKDEFAAYSDSFSQAQMCSFADRDIQEKAYQDSVNSVNQEAFIIPGKVSYNILGYQSEYSGVNLVLSRILSFDYLWKEIRIKGGAYGAGMQLARSGAVTLYSYRDPNVKETFDVYQKITDYLVQSTFTEEEMTQYIIGTMAQYDTVLKPRAIANRLDRQYFTAETEEMRANIRKEICAVTSEQIQKQAEKMKNLLHTQNYCTFGCKETVEKAKGMFSQTHSI
ncbi:insulinase family protein [Scatolibacter rhodanostii]|uniref:insulinase family protein n=1 Tax=Scatolibacter rhodanostii TaxID=2014781 RepID=UPI000C080283|nr:insulinase family protein [Scatolibacter rhodanostii]